MSGTVTQQAGGGTTQTMNSISCTSASTCEAVGGAGTILCTTDGGTTWTTQSSGVTVTLNGVSCNSSGCVAAGSAPSGGSGTILTAANGGGSWTSQTSGVSANLNGVACVSSDCWAVGAIPSGTTTAAIVASANGGTSWQAQTSNAPQPLSSIACADNQDCFAGGAIGTVMATNTGRSTWYQEGDPISGPTTALNAGPTTITAIDGAACSRAACFMATASSGNIMTTPLLTVTVNASGAFGTTPDLTDLAPGSAALSYSPATAASSVTGGLSCSTTATGSSDAGSYPISGCSGLSAEGYNVIYDYTDSSYQVTQASNTITFAGIPDQTFGNASFEIDPTSSSGLPVSVRAQGACSLDSGTAPANVTITVASNCSITASQAGDNDYAPAQDVTQPFSIAQASQIIDFTSPSPHTYGDASFEIYPTATSGLTVSLSSSGPCSLDSGTSPANVSITGTGQCNITASQDGDTDYSAAPNVTQSFNIALANQTITFGPLANRKFSGTSYTLHATASSGLPVSYSVGSTDSCAVSGATLTLTGASSCTVTAAQSGNGAYLTAQPVSRTFQISWGIPKVVVTATPVPATLGPVTYHVTVQGFSGTAATGSVRVSDGTKTCTVASLSSGAGECSINEAAGSYTVTASYSGDTNYLAATGTKKETVRKGKATVAITPSANPAPAPGSVSYLVSVTGANGFTPAGSVFVSDGGGRSCSITLSAGSGSCSINEAKGTHHVTAEYLGSSQYQGASKSIAEKVQ